MRVLGCTAPGQASFVAIPPAWPAGHDLSTIAIVRGWRGVTAGFVFGLGALGVLSAWAMWAANPADDADRGPSARLLQISLVAWVAGTILLLIWVRRRR